MKDHDRITERSDSAQQLGYRSEWSPACLPQGRREQASLQAGGRCRSGGVSGDGFLRGTYVGGIEPLPGSRQRVEDIELQLTSPGRAREGAAQPQGAAVRTARRERI